MAADPVADPVVTAIAASCSVYKPWSLSAPAYLHVAVVKVLYVAGRCLERRGS